MGRADHTNTLDCHRLVFLSAAAAGGCFPLGSNRTSGWLHGQGMGRGTVPYSHCHFFHLVLCRPSRRSEEGKHREIPPLFRLFDRHDIDRFLLPLFDIPLLEFGRAIQPWTISSEVVWKKTHALGGALFKISALIALAGMLFPNLAIWLVAVPVAGSALGAVIYSYVIYEREKKA